MSLSELLKSHSWDADWPAAVKEEFAPAPLLAPATSHGPLPPANLAVATVNQMIGAMLGTGSCPLNTLRQALDELTAWSNQSPHLTYPPSLSGWHQAYLDLCHGVDVDPASTGHLQGLLFVTACYPRACRALVATLPVSPSQQLLSSALSLAPAPAVASPPSASSNSPPASAPAPSSTPTFRAPALLPRLTKIASLLLTGDWDAPTKKEWFDNKLKWMRKQNHETTSDGWFVNQLFPALAALPQESLTVLQQYWPNTTLAISDPDLLGSNKFWGILKRAPARDYLLTDFLPKLISLANPSVSGLYHLGKELVEHTVNNPAEFAKRLHLWQALGGDLDLSLPTRSPSSSAPSADSLFASAPITRTFRTYLVARSIPAWDQVLLDFPPPGAKKASSFSP